MSIGTLGAKKAQHLRVAGRPAKGSYDLLSMMMGEEAAEEAAEAGHLEKRWTWETPATRGTQS